MVRLRAYLRGGSANTAFQTNGAPFDDSANDSSADGSEVRKPEKPQFDRAVAFVMGSDDSLQTPVDPGIASRAASKRSAYYR
ncbi:hypothetical protein DL770_002863 [Monosporascus sp. CRB-9-2]|nr:hypothetical protein DL770_002863 [Monosporascus sp. CRB-9-2]